MLGIVIQIDGWDPVPGAAVALRASSHDDAAVCHMDGATWWPAIAKLPTLRYDLFDGDFGGQITAPASSMTLRTEPWPEFGRYSLADARFRLWTGEVGASWSEWTLRFDGRLTSRPAIRDGAAELAFAVDDRWLDTPLLATYAGTGGIEGPEALKGTAKPLALGAPRYVPGILVDAIATIFQVSAYGAIVAVDEALEKLAGFGLPVADHPSFAALEAAEIPRGRFATCRARGLVRFGAPTEGTTCFQVRGDMAGPDGWARRPGRLIRRLAQLAGGLDRVSDSSLAALDAARPYNLSIYLDQQTTARDLIQRLAASINAVAGVSWLGKLFVLPVAIGAPSLTLAADGSALPPVASVEELEIAAPWKRLAIGAERAWTVHQLSDVAFTAPLTERGAYAADTIYREGDIVSLPDGSRWLRQAAVPSAGIDPVEGTTWTLLTGKVLPKWEDIADPNGTKPTNGADKTSENTAKDTAAIGGVPSDEVLAAIRALEDGGSGDAAGAQAARRAAELARDAAILARDDTADIRDAADVSARAAAASATGAAGDAVTADGHAKTAKQHSDDAGVSAEAAQAQVALAATEAGVAKSEAAEALKSKKDAEAASVSASRYERLSADSAAGAQAVLEATRPPTLSPQHRTAYSLPFAEIIGPSSEWPQAYLANYNGGTFSGERQVSFTRHIPKAAGRRYRAECWVFSYATNVGFYLAFSDLNEDGSGLRFLGFGDTVPGAENNVTPTATGFRRLAIEYTVPAGAQPLIRPYLGFQSGAAASNGGIHHTGIVLTDVTSEAAAGGSAAASAESARVAGVKATDAGREATAAQNERVKAETAQDGANTSAVAAEGSAATAGREAGAAAESARLAAGHARDGASTLAAITDEATGVATQLGAYGRRIEGVEASAGGAAGGLGGNPNFAVWPDGQELPAAWGSWPDANPARRAVARAATGSPGSPNAVSWNAYGNQESGMVQNAPGLQAAGWYDITVDAELAAGATWEGSGITFVGGRFPFPFASTPDADGITSATRTGRRRWNIRFQKGADDTFAYYGMANTSQFGALHGKVINWYFLDVRPTDSNLTRPGDGLLARTQIAQSAAVDVKNRLEVARLDFVAETSGGRASFTLASNNVQGARWKLVGDGEIDGSLTLRGSLNIDRVDALSAARYGQSAWSGLVQPGPGQAATIPWGLTLPGILPRGRFIWEYRATVVTNAGTQAPPATHNGRPFYTRYLADEPGTGLIVSASDAQGNIYSARSNAADPVRAITPFDAAFSAIVRRGSYDSGIVDDGDYYYRELSATWTVSAFYLAVTWIGV